MEDLMENVLLNDVEAWSFNQFSRCNLGDERRTKRLIKMAAQLAQQVGRSLSLSCTGNQAALEGGYRFVRNHCIDPYAILEGHFEATKELVKDPKLLLALEDTTSLSYKHSVNEELGPINNNLDSKSRGFEVHSVLICDPSTQRTLGLIEQNTWQRRSDKQTRKERHTREYKEKESYKWEKSSDSVAKRLGDDMSKVISVCDREADIYDYLHYKIENNQRFVVRAAFDRVVDDEEYHNLSDHIADAKELGRYKVQVEQRGGRKARQATVTLKSAQVCIKPPSKCSHKTKNPALKPLEVNLVIAQEEKPSKGVTPLRWIILTSEPISNFEETQLVIFYYQKRWHIEEFHKAWKTGAGVEKQRMQSGDNLQRMLSILAVVAIRLLQLREALSKKDDKVVGGGSCLTVLTKEECAVLWSFINKGSRKKPLKKSLTMRWAYEAIAKLGGWTDSKRTGIAGWLTMWHGWFRLQERLEGYMVAQGVQKL